MKEIEVLVEVLDSSENVIDKLKKFKYEGEKETRDIYYVDPLKENLKPNLQNQLNECFRLRNKDDKSYITYKKDYFEENRKWLYSDEYETKVESYEIFQEIIKKIRF